MQERTEWLLGDLLTDITDKTIVIIGVGGVGSYALETLARIGFKRIIIADHDITSLSNINRQVMCLHSNIGQKKVDVWENRIQDINPDCEVITVPDFINENNMEQLFQYPIDYVVDACDTLKTKEAILSYCINHRIKVISSMGMANRLDSSKIKVGTLDKTYNDPLAKRLRLWAKKEHISSKINVVYSEEVPIKQKRLGSIAHVPATAGLCITNKIVQDFLKEALHEK